MVSLLKSRVCRSSDKGMKVSYSLFNSAITEHLRKGREQLLSHNSGSWEYRTYEVTGEGLLLSLHIAQEENPLLKTHPFM